MTTSPNVLIYSAMDGWRRQMVQHGNELLSRALRLATDVRQAIEALPGLSVMEKERIHKEASHDLDRLQVLIDVATLSISGYQAADWLKGPIVSTLDSVTTAEFWSRSRWLTTP